MENKPLNFEQFIREFYKNYVIDEMNSAVIRKITLWVDRDPAFEDFELGHHLKKGNLIFGPVGTGKTDLFDLLQIYLNQYTRSKYAFTKSVVWSFTADFSKNGYESLNSQEVGNRYYDELCLTNDRTKFPEKENAMHFGSKLLVGEEIILVRYNAFKQHGFQTHFSTNADFEELKAIYGERAYSRLTEMCNFFALEGDDRRLCGNPNIYNDIHEKKPTYRPREVSAQEIEANKKMLDDEYKKFVETGIIEDNASWYINLLRHYGCDIVPENRMEELRGLAGERYAQPLIIGRMSDTEKSKDRDKFVGIEANKLAVMDFFTRMKNAKAKTIFGLVEVNLGMADMDGRKIGKVGMEEIVTIQEEQKNS